LTQSSFFGIMVSIRRNGRTEWKKDLTMDEQTARARAKQESWKYGGIEVYVGTTMNEHTGKTEWGYMAKVAWDSLREPARTFFLKPVDTVTGP